VKKPIAVKPHKPFWGLFRRRECVVLTLRGWLLFLFGGLVLGMVAVKRVQPFLAVTDQIRGEALIVEGWEPDYALEEVIAEFKKNGYSKLYVTGGPLGVGSHLSEYKNYADLGAATLTRLGLNPDVIQPVPTPPVRKDRTYAGAIELKNWLQLHSVATTNFTLISMGAHSRRSRLLFEKGLGEGKRVGIIAIASRDYDANRWWTSSEGVRTVTDEAIAYFYAIIFFRPDKEQ
jgi:hypothetical protein